MICEREEEMEELVLNTLSPARAQAAEEHRSSCVSCTEAYDVFAEERALFTRRATVIIAPAPARRSFFGSARSRDLWSVTRVAAAALACAAAIVCVFRDHKTTAANEVAPPEPAATLHAAAEEGLACAYPASGFSPGSLASVAPPTIYASNDLGVCEAQPTISSGP